MSPNFYTGLVHHPVKNKKGEQVTTSVTNLDISDISRSATTFGHKRYFIISPIKKQQELVHRILGHWHSDEGNLYNPDRSNAMSRVQMVASIEDAIAEIQVLEKCKPLVVVTTALDKGHDGGCKELVEKIRVDNRPMLLLFGTGWGLIDEVMAQADFRLEPIWGADRSYNHLSVRSAVAIYLDRLQQELEK